MICYLCYSLSDMCTGPVLLQCPLLGHNNVKKLIYRVEGRSGMQTEIWGCRKAQILLGVYGVQNASWVYGGTNAQKCMMAAMLFKNIYMYCSKEYFSKVYFSKVFIPKMYFSEVYPTSVSSKLCKFIQKVLTVQTLIFSSNPSEFKQIRPHYCLNAVKVYIIKDKQFCLEIWWK